MRYIRVVFVVLLVTGVLALGANPLTTSAQTLLPEPTVGDGPNPGEVIVSWEAIPEAKYYRVGWMAETDYSAALADNREWLDAFVFVDVENRGQTSYAVSRLNPGAFHYFIMGRVDERFGEAQWSSWTSVTVRAALSACPVGAQGSAAIDRVALEAIYRATSGPNWTNRTNWLSDRPLDDWHGITTDANGRVVELSLRDNNLSGEISAAVGILTELTRLNLGRNGLAGSIPAELGQLANLEELYLLENQFSGPIPPELGNLSEIRIFYLYRNQLTGTLPPSLANLTNVERFSVRDNRLNGQIPPWLGDLSKMEWLRLDRNQFTGQIPQSLSRLSSVTLLVLAGNQLTGSIPSWLGDMTSLERLSLSNNRLTGDIPAELGNLPNLALIRLAGNQLTGCIPDALQDVADTDFAALGLHFCGATPGASTSERDALVALYNATGGPNWTNRAGWLSDQPLNNWHGVTTNSDEQVVELRLLDNGLVGTIPPELGSLSELVYLQLSENRLMGPIPDQLENLSKLDRFYLWENQLTGPIPSWLGNLGNLRRLALSRNRSDGTIPGTLGNLSNLNLINFGGNDLSGPIPPQLQNLHNLEEFNLWQNRLSGPVPTWLSNLGNLTHINLNENQLTGTIPSELGSLSNLTRLSLADNQLTGDVPTSLGNLTNLERLRLAGNNLTGCIPNALLSVQENDLLGLVLHTCGSPPSGSDEVRRFDDSEVGYLKWELGPGVPDAHYSHVREGVLHLHRYATPLGLPELPDDATVYLYADRELMAQTLARLERRPLDNARESVNSGDWGGLAGLEDEDSGWVMIHLHRAARHGPLALVGVAAHELSHVYQYALQKHGRFSNTHSEVRVIGPAWMQEGVAEFHRWVALANGGEWTYEQRREHVLDRARRVDVTLKETETYDGLLAGNDRFDLAALAAELLAAESSEAALIKFWTLLEPGTTWQQVFETSFGMTIDEFYPLFEAHRANGFPTLGLN